VKLSKGLFLRVFVSLAALGGLIYALRGKLIEAIHLLGRGFEWKWFVLAIFVYLVATVVISCRLQLIFRVQGVKVKLVQAFYLSLLGLFFNLFFPSAMGGDVAKGYFAYQYSGKKLGSLTGVLLDRLLGFVTLILIALGALAFYVQKPALPMIKPAIYGAALFLIFGIAFFASRRFAGLFQFLSFLVPSQKLRQKISDVYHAIREYRNHKKLLFICALLSFAGQFIYLVDVYLLSLSLGLPLSLEPFLVLMPLIAFSGLAPSVSGLGVREAAFVFFFKGFLAFEQAFALSLLYDLLYYGCAIAAGLVFAVKGGLKSQVIQGLEEAEKLEGVGL